METLNDSIRITRLVKPVLLRATNLIPMLIPDFPFFVVPSGTYSVGFQYYELKDVPKAVHKHVHKHVHKPNFDLYSCEHSCVHSRTKFLNLPASSEISTHASFDTSHDL